MTSRRVAYVMTHHPRVATTFITDEIDELTRTGFEIVPIAMNTPGAKDLATPGAVEASEQTLYLKADGPLRLARSFLRLFRTHPIGVASLVLTALRSARLDMGVAVRRLVHLVYAARALEHCRSQGVHHLHAHFGLAPATIAWFAARLSRLDGGAPCTWSFTIHGFHDFVNETDSRLDLKVADAEFVACVSDFTRSQLCRVADPRFWPRFHVVRCGIDLERFSRREPRPPSPIPTILVVARLSPEKGHLVLIHALAAMRDAGVTATVEIVGSGPFEGAIREEARRLGLHDAVHFLGELPPDEVTERLHAADVFCLPSFSEGLPVSIMEAMASGVPVVSTAISGIPELAVDGESALTVPPGNADELSAALVRLVSEPGLAECLTTRAAERVGARHALSHTAPQLGSLFDRVQGSPSR